jgi:hypothetical protein
MCFSAAALVLALVGIAVRLKPLWPEAPGIRECFLIAFDGMIVFGAVWAAGWALARSYQIDDQRRAPKPSTPSLRLRAPRGETSLRMRVTAAILAIIGFMAFQLVLVTRGISSEGNTISWTQVWTKLKKRIGDVRGP